jgi:Uma2 family endonuclease
LPLEVTIQQPYFTEPVELCIGILSPDDRLKRAIEKGRRYVDWGVSSVWIINPVERSAWVLTQESPEGIWIHSDGILTAGEYIQIPLTELFSEVDKLL